MSRFNRTATRLIAALAMSLAALTLEVPASMAPASAAGHIVCEKGSDSYAGVCFKQLSSLVRGIKVVQAVPLINGTSHRRANMHCSFSDTVTKSLTLGGSTSMTVSAKASILDLAEVSASTTYTLSASVTQTAASASEAGGSVTLPPHTQVVCQRIYSYVTFRVQRQSWHGTSTSNVTKRVTVPSSLGVRIVD